MPTEAEKAANIVSKELHKTNQLLSEMNKTLGRLNESLSAAVAEMKKEKN